MSKVGGPQLRGGQGHLGGGLSKRGGVRPSKRWGWPPHPPPHARVCYKQRGGVLTHVEFKIIPMQAFQAKKSYMILSKFKLQKCLLGIIYFIFMHTQRFNAYNAFVLFILADHKCFCTHKFEHPIFSHYFFIIYSKRYTLNLLYSLPFVLTAIKWPQKT